MLSLDPEAPAASRGQLLFGFINCGAFAADAFTNPAQAIKWRDRMEGIINVFNRHGATLIGLSEVNDFHKFFPLSYGWARVTPPQGDRSGVQLLYRTDSWAVVPDTCMSMRVYPEWATPACGSTTPGRAQRHWRRQFQVQLQHRVDNSIHGIGVNHTIDGNSNVDNGDGPERHKCNSTAFKKEVATRAVTSALAASQGHACHVVGDWNLTLGELGKSCQNVDATASASELAAVGVGSCHGVSTFQIRIAKHARLDMKGPDNKHTVLLLQIQPPQDAEASEPPSHRRRIEGPDAAEPDSLSHQAERVASFQADVAARLLAASQEQALQEEALQEAAMEEDFVGDWEVESEEDSGPEFVAPKEEALAASQGQPFRREGLPCRAVVQRSGDRFVVSSPAEMTDFIRRVLRCRADELNARGSRTYEEFLPLDAQKRIREKVESEWLQEPQTQLLSGEVWRRACATAREATERGERASPNDLYKRSMRSYWKTTVFHRFGGLPWLYALSAIGHVPASFVETYQAIIDEKIRAAGREPQAQGPVAGPRLSERALAASQGHDVPPIRGVQHRVSDAKRLRQQAQQTGKHLKRASDAWWGELRAHGPHARETVLAQRKHEDLERQWSRKWDLAEAASRQKGEPFTNRWGDRELAAAEDSSNFGRAIKQWRDEEHADILQTEFP